jgi:hypothetical protein
MLILVGILMVSDRFTMMATWLQDLTPEWLRDRI